MTSEAQRKQTSALFRQHGGALRMADALRAGVSRNTLYGMREAGLIEPLSRGLYRLTSLRPLGNPDLVTVAARIPRGVISLVSALAFHELTTQIPHAVDVALPRGSTQPRLEYPPISVYRFSGAAFTEGIEHHELDGLPVKIYSAEKTVADCFKYRHKLGMEIVLEALRTWRRRRGADMGVLLKHAKTCRVAVVMRPYLEALT